MAAAYLPLAQLPRAELLYVGVLGCAGNSLRASSNTFRSNMTAILHAPHQGLLRQGRVFEFSEIHIWITRHLAAETIAKVLYA